MARKPSNLWIGERVILRSIGAVVEIADVRVADRTILLDPLDYRLPLFEIAYDDIESAIEFDEGE